MRARAADFLDSDRAVAGAKLSGLDRPPARALAVGARPWFFPIGGLLIGAELAQPAGDGAPHVMSPPLNRGQVDFGVRALGAEAVPHQSLEEALNLGIIEKTGR